MKLTIDAIRKLLSPCEVSVRINPGRIHGLIELEIKHYVPHEMYRPWYGITAIRKGLRKHQPEEFRLTVLDAMLQFVDKVDVPKNTYLRIRQLLNERTENAKEDSHNALCE